MGIIFVRFLFRDVFGCVQQCDKISSGRSSRLVFKFAGSGQNVYRVISKVAKIEIEDFISYARRGTPSFDNESLVNDHILSQKGISNLGVSQEVPLSRWYNWSKSGTCILVFNNVFYHLYIKITYIPRILKWELKTHQLITRRNFFLLAFNQSDQNEGILLDTSAPSFKLT